MSLYDELKNYSDSDMYPFHMPGHKRQGMFMEAEKLDITEIHGFDNLYYPNGILNELKNVLVNGSTGGILAGIRTLTKFGDRVLIARNCHKSVYNAVELCGLKAEFIIPKPASDNGKELNIYGAVSPYDVEKKLWEFPDTTLVVITSPTYEGICSDIQAIAKICSSRGVRLFTDGAHGSHLSLHNAGSCYSKPMFFSKPATLDGADLTVMSLHKTLPALTQTALIDSRITDKQLLSELRENLSVFQTSSPSYVLLASAESALRFMDSRSAADMFCKRLKKFYAETADLHKLKILFNSDLSNHLHDCGKILVSTSDVTLSGYELSSILRERFLIETEMSAPDYVLALSTVADTDQGFERLARALREIDLECEYASDRKPSYLIRSVPKRTFIPFEKYKHKSKLIPLRQAEGCVAMDTIMAYPPGVPCIVPGEVFNSEIIDYISKIKNSGGEILCRSMSEYPFDRVNVAEL